MEVLCWFHGYFPSSTEGAVSRFTTCERRWDGLSSGDDARLMKEVTLWVHMSGDIYCTVVEGRDWCRLWLNGKKRKNSGRKGFIFRAKCGVCFVGVKMMVMLRKFCWWFLENGRGDWRVFCCFGGGRKSGSKFVGEEKKNYFCASWEVLFERFRQLCKMRVGIWDLQQHKNW